MDKIEEFLDKNRVDLVWDEDSQSEETCISPDGDHVHIDIVRELIQLVREECKQEMLSATSVMLHPHIEGVFAVIEEKSTHGE